MSGTYYCHECEERRSMVLTPLETCSICGCHYIEEIPIVLEDQTTTDEEEDFNRELDFFFTQEREEDNADDDEELLEERCLYEQLSSIYNHSMARNLDSNSLSSTIPQRRRLNIDDSVLHSTQLPPPLQPTRIGEEEQEEPLIDFDVDSVEDIVTYDVLFEQSQSGPITLDPLPTTSQLLEGEPFNPTDLTTSRSIFQLPFARIGRLLDTMYSYDEEEEEDEDGSEDNYHRRSFLDNLADILSDYTQDIENTSIPSRPLGPSIDVILSSLKKKYLQANDPDVEDECIICQDAYSTSLEIYHLPCHHKFHGTCISRWLNIKTSCPVCRRPAHHEIKSEEEEVDITAISENTTSRLRQLEDLDNSNEEDNYFQLLDTEEGANLDSLELGSDSLEMRLERLRQELVVRRNHWVSSSPSNYQLNPIPSTTSQYASGGSNTSGDGYSTDTDIMDSTPAVHTTSMEEVD